MSKAIGRIKDLMNGSNSIKQAVGILFVTVLISNVLGLIRNIIIANRVGVTYGSIGALDQYYAAFVLPDLLYNLIIVGALTSAVLPILATLEVRNEQERFWQTFNTILSTGLIVLVGGLFVLFYLLPWLIPLIVPGFTPDQQHLTSQLAQALLLSPLFFTVSQLATSALQAKKRFLAPALAPIIYNLSIIASALLIPQYGLSVLVLGVIFGAVGHFLIQMPAMLGLGWRFRARIALNDPHINNILKLMLPRAVALTGNQLLLLVFYRLASNFEEGSIAIYRLTDDLQTAPVLLLANTLAMAVLPDFVRRIARNNQLELEELLGKTLRLMTFIFLPLTAFILINRTTIVDLYLAIGHSVEYREVSLAADTLGMFVVSLVFQAGILILVRAYFARGETLRPTIFSLFSLVLSYSVARWSAHYTDWGVIGLAGAFSASSVLNAVLLWRGLRLPLRLIWRDQLGRLNLPAIAFGTLLVATAASVFEQIAPAFSRLFLIGPSGANMIELTIGFLLSGGVYMTWSRVINLEQWHLLKPWKVSGPK